MITPAKLAANRRNAQLSTGPKTPEGQARSAQNATKHGLFAQNPVLPTEKPDEYQAVRQQFFDELQPEGILETVLVERIINAVWRMRRFGQIEAEMLGLEFNRLEESEENRLGLAFVRRESTDHQLGRLYRYEMALERSMYRALKELAQLQAARRSEGTNPKSRAGKTFLAGQEATPTVPGLENARTNPPPREPQGNEADAAELPLQPGAERLAQQLDQSVPVGIRQVPKTSHDLGLRKNGELVNPN